MPELRELISPSPHTALVSAAFRAIFVYTIWKWARTRRFNNYGQAPKPVTDVDLALKASKIHSVWNRHSFASAAHRKLARDELKRLGPEDREQIRRIQELLPTAA